MLPLSLLPPITLFTGGEAGQLEYAAKKDRVVTSLGDDEKGADRDTRRAGGEVGICLCA